ncbi:MAG: type VI secretion system baseplate subunit TssF [Planctomycetia bacterium]|nr:type VI secretion system baseplate subunit TssF [Planctomycetia bacterium]
MSDDLLPYYDRELAILRTLAGEFAEQHPKIAGRLSLGRDESQDPHVERMLQGVAFLAARVQKRLDDDYPELTDGLLDLLYPHYLRPVPSLAITEFAIDPKQAQLTSGYRIPRGTPVETEEVEGERCRYRTCFEQRLWPLRVAAAALSGPPFQLPIVPPAGTVAVLSLAIETLSSEVRVGQMPLDSLRLHLHAEAGQSMYELYELLLTRCLGVVIADGPTDAQAVVLPRDRLVAAGFDPADAAIPDDPRSFSGYRLLSEFFALPQKFLFVDLKGLTPQVIGRIGRTMHVSILLSATSRELERVLSPRAIRLGCTPIVNLFTQQLDPMRIDGARSEYCITPDARRPRAVEVYSLESVQAGRAGDEPVDVLPFYAVASGAETTSVAAVGPQRRLRWLASRRTHREPRPDGVTDAATDSWLSVVDEAGGPAAVADLIVHMRAVCTNRNLPARLPFAIGRPRLTLPDGQGPVGAVTCLTRPTRPLRTLPGRGAAWRIISHLSLNHLSLADSGDGRAPQALREMLRLYLLDDLDDYDQKQRWIQGIVGVSSRRVAARVGERGGVCQGVEIRLEIDEERFSDGAAYLFSSVIDRFLGGWVNINAFTRLVSTSRERESRREQWTWPPRAGGRVLA